ncbi:MAG TPA: DUF2059 domain-containing protein [Opitutaceae bacterium]|nr:DUF2059 domain-containing protein [Opitutaceae bacterium]
MKRLLLAVALVCAPAFAADTPPSDASIAELLNLADAPKLIDGMMSQVDGMIQQSIDQSLHGQQVTPEQKAAIDKYKAKSVAIMHEELAWTKLEPLYTRIYRESLTQEEVDGIIAIYKTPAGQAMVKKLPLVMQKVMAEMPAMMNPLMQKLQAAAQEFAAEMQAAEVAKALPAK